MLIAGFYLANILVLLPGIASFRRQEGQRKFSIALIQTIFFLPLLACEYLAVVFDLVPDAAGFTCVLISQNLFLIVWISLAGGLCDALAAAHQDQPGIIAHLQTPIVLLLLAITLIQVLSPDFSYTGSGVIFEHFGSVYISSLVSLLTMTYMAWQLELFWRQLPRPRRREYLVFVVGIGLVCAGRGWAASYRLAYLQLSEDVVKLQAVVLLLAWVLITFATLRHRLLNRKIFISRKIVYSFIAPSLFAAYLIGLGLIALVMRLTGHSLHFVLSGFLIILGLTLTAVLALSDTIRQQLKFFISTHFYVNKYEYRDEWIAFSEFLKEAHTEEDVLLALRRILTDSLYTRDILLWTGDEKTGFSPVADETMAGQAAYKLSGADPLIRHLQQNPRLYREEGLHGNEFAELREWLSTLPGPAPVLFVPIAAGGQLLGCIGLGPEYIGGRYGQDDFDLLTALGSQTASALLAVRLAEQTARMREQQALHGLAVFVLHDIKNAASMLSLVHANANRHMDNPEFRKDLLVAIEDALRRMDKVRRHLNSLRGIEEPNRQEVQLGAFFNELASRFNQGLSNFKLDVVCPNGLALRTDPELLTTVFENLIINAREANPDGTKIQITVMPAEKELLIELRDNGPGIPAHLLPDRLFQPFASGKTSGHGIGLWQARTLLTQLGGEISAENLPARGARFVIRLNLAMGGLPGMNSHLSNSPQGVK